MQRLVSATNASVMMNAPAPNLWPPASNSRSAADIFTSLCRKRNVTSVLSVVWSTMRTRPVPATAPAILKSLVASVIGFSKTALSSTR